MRISWDKKVGMKIHGALQNRQSRAWSHTKRLCVCERDVAIVGAVTEKEQRVFLDVELRTSPVTPFGVVLLKTLDRI